MNVIKLYEELIRNPNSLKVYRELQTYYSLRNMKFEAEAFVEILKVKIGDANHTSVDKQ